MTKITLTYDEAKTLLEKAVSELGGDYVYENVREDSEFPFDRCMYFNPQTKAPSCIVGHILAYKGVTYDDAENGNWNAGVNAEDLVDRGIIECDGDDTQDLLENVQMYQDSGLSWGRALERAINGDDNDDHRIF